MRDAILIDHGVRKHASRMDEQSDTAQVPVRIHHVVEAVGQRVRIAHVRHPQRRRVGMQEGRLGLHMTLDRLVDIADVIAVGVGGRFTGEPRILEEVVRRIGVALKTKLVIRTRTTDRIGPVVVDRRPRNRVRNVPAFGNDVDRSVKRVETVEEFVEVIHAVRIGIAVARIAADVLGRIVLRDRERRRRHQRHLAMPPVLVHRLLETGFDLEIVIDTVLEIVEFAVFGIPLIVTPRHVDARMDVLAAQARVIVGAFRIDDEPVDVLVVACRDATQIRLMEGPRRDRVVITPAAHRADHVLLPVLEAVVIVVEHRVVERAVHAAVPGGRGSGLGHVGRKRTVGVLDDIRGGRGVGRLVSSLELDFPRVGKHIEVGIPEVRIETAAFDAVVKLLVAADLVAVNEVQALLAVDNAITVGIIDPRVGRPHLILPFRMRIDDRRTLTITEAALNTGEFLGPEKSVIGERRRLSVISDLRREEASRTIGLRIRSLAGGLNRRLDVKLPTVGHRVIIGVGLVRISAGLRPKVEDILLVGLAVDGVGRGRHILREDTEVTPVERLEEELVKRRVVLGVENMIVLARSHVPAGARIEALMMINLIMETDHLDLLVLGDKDIGHRRNIGGAGSPNRPRSIHTVYPSGVAEEISTLIDSEITITVGISNCRELLVREVYVVSANDLPLGVKNELGDHVHFGLHPRHRILILIH